MAIDATKVGGGAGVTQLPPGSTAAVDPSDAFLKKAGDWAFNTYFLSTLNPVEEMAGHRPLQAQDAEVMHYVTAQLPSANRLPTGHMYAETLSETFSELSRHVGNGQIDEASLVEAMLVLEADVALRDYMAARQLEYYYF